MDVREAVGYLDSLQWFGSKPGLERVGRLLNMLGRPQDKLRFVHIAGTNGKGSCAAMLSSVLRAAGYRTGLFTSPYLLRFNERMKIDGAEISGTELAGLVERVKPLAESLSEHPTEFEVITAAALLWYAERKCDVVVLEVGLGGRLDATNIIKSPEVSVIMNIGLDHTAVLGGTVEEIAGEKAGIIKPGRPCVLYGQSGSVERVVREKCRAEAAVLFVSCPDEISCLSDSLDGQVFTYRGERYSLPLLGENQRKNAAVVIEAARVLEGLGWRTGTQALREGLASVSWPARFEIASRKPMFVVDGGHNPQCAQAVAENLLNYFPDTRRVLLMGVLADKDYPGLTSLLSPVADEFICVTPDSPRALPAEALAAHLKRYSKPVRVCGSIEQGVDAAAEAAGENGMACAVGSLYMAGRVRAALGLS